MNHLGLCNKHPRLSGHDHCSICLDLVSEIQVGFSRSAPQCSVILGASARLAGMAGTGWDGLGWAGTGWDLAGMRWDLAGMGWDWLGLGWGRLGQAGTLTPCDLRATHWGLGNPRWPLSHVWGLGTGC